MRRSTLVVLSVLVIGYVSIGPCYKDCAYADNYTGSSRGERVLIFGLTVGRWFRESSLETRLKSMGAFDGQRKWISYAGTLKNIWGSPFLRAHGFPAKFVMNFVDFGYGTCTAQEWLSRQDNAEVRLIFEILKSEDQDRIKALSDRFDEDVSRMIAQ